MFLTPGAKLARKVDVNTSLYNTIAQTRGEAAAAKSVSACRAFQELRAALHEPPTTEATRLGIKRYLSALHYATVENNIPSVTAVDLLWVNAFDGDDVSVLNDLALDHVAALFNLAVCEATLATVAFRTRRTDRDSVKRTARHFQTAAGYFKAAAALPAPGGIRKVTCDMYPPALKALEFVMLGNAQQALYHIALDAGNANAILAKFAVGARDFYSIAEDSCKEPDVVNTCINGYVGRPAGALAAYFDVVAQSAQANACMDTHDMPQQLARLARAQTSLQAGLTTVTALDTSSLASVATLRSNLVAALESLKKDINTRKEDAETENRKVYFATPATSCPEIIGRQGVKPADVAKVLQEEPVDQRLRVFDELPEPLSAALSGVAAKYSDMVTQTVADEVASINTAALQLQETVLKVEKSISSARASAAAEASRPATVAPPSKLEDERRAIDAVRHAQQSGGLGTLAELQGQVLKLGTETKMQIQDIEKLLQTEEAEDRQLRARIHVTRPTSATLSQPYVAKLSSIRANLEQAANADLIVKRQIDQNAFAVSQLDALNIVGFSPPSAAAPVAPAAGGAQRVEAVVAEMQPKIATGKQLLVQKNVIAQEFEKKKHLDNPYVATAGIPDGDVERCTAAISKEYGALKQQAKSVCEEMDSIAQFLSDANVRLTLPAPRNDDQGNEGQQKMNEVYKHQAAALKFAELMGHLEQGTMFYTREQDVVAVLKRDIEGFVAARRAEAQDLTNAQSAPSTSSYPQQGTLYPTGPPQYPPSNPSYPPSTPSYPPNPHGYQQNPYGGQQSYQGPPGAWRRH